MDNIQSNNLTTPNTLEELKKTRDLLSSQIKRIREKDTIKIQAYIPAELKKSLDIAVEWAFLSGLIKFKTRWSFAKFAVANAITLIINQKKQEDAQKAIAVLYESPQIPPNEIIPNSQIPESFR